MHLDEQILMVVVAKSRQEIRLEGVMLFIALLAAGAILYAVLPRHHLKISITMMISGMLLLIPVMLVGWNILKISPPVDGKMHILDYFLAGSTIGGFALFIAGCALGVHIKRLAASGRKNDTDTDDQ